MDQFSRPFQDLCSSLKLDSSGRLTVTGQEMILLPRHFLRFILREVKNSVGDLAFREVFQRAGRYGAMEFCRYHCQVEGCSADQAVEHYLVQVGVRGWGTFSLIRFEEEGVEIGILNSALVKEGDLPDGHAMWEGVVQGILMFLRGASGLDLTGQASVQSQWDGEWIRISAVWNGS